MEKVARKETSQVPHWEGNYVKPEGIPGALTIARTMRISQSVEMVRLAEPIRLLTSAQGVHDSAAFAYATADYSGMKWVRLGDATEAGITLNFRS